jgi:dTMP kinase
VPRRLRRGCVVVLEGPDRTGKTTQFERLQGVLQSEGTLFAHMPTGLSAFTRGVRHLMEEPGSRPQSGLAQQLAHLSCHAESQGALRSQLVTGSVVLDRWWWSTVAYGWFGGAVAESGISESMFEQLIGSVWDGVDAQVVFLFATPHQEDTNNSSAVVAGYEALGERFPEQTLRVPPGEIGDVTDWIVEQLDRRQLFASD